MAEILVVGQVSELESLESVSTTWTAPVCLAISVKHELRETRDLVLDPLNSLLLSVVQVLLFYVPRVGTRAEARKTEVD